MEDLTADKERKYQNNLISIFKDKEGLDYIYLGNFEYLKGKTDRKNLKGEDVQNTPIIETDVYSFLTDVQGCTDYQAKDAISQLKKKASLPSVDIRELIDVNTSVYELLTGGVKSKPSPEENEKDVMFFDFNNPHNNRFCIAEEVSFVEPLTKVHSDTHAHCRPDLVIYVNGIALAIIELKRSIVSVDEGIKQHLSNQGLIPSFFTTTQFTIAATDGAAFKYATLATPIQFWCDFKPDTNDDEKYNDVDSFKNFFDKEKFMHFFRFGVITDGGWKKVMRPHQFYALRAAMGRLAIRESGVIWHSQGSGKSLTMIWLARYINAMFENPRVIVITDRTELDIQIKNGFTNAGDKICHPKDSSELLDKLNASDEWLLCTLIHKFGSHGTSEHDRDEEEKKIPIRLDKFLEELRNIIKAKYPQGFSVKGDNIFVFIDECHRTQSGNLHEGMREILGDNVMIIGFTGTPLLKEEKEKAKKEQKDTFDKIKNVTEYRIGPFIHKYLHKQAVKDKVILDLEYEARDVEQIITDEEELENKKNEITQNLSKERKQLIEDRWATLEKVYSSKERIERIGYSILNDVEKETGLLHHNWCNAMLVAGDIYSAYRYYDFFQNNNSNTTLRNRCAVVTSFIPNDDVIRKKTSDVTKKTEEHFKYEMAWQSYNDAPIPKKNKNNNESYGAGKLAELYETWAKDEFINKPGRMKLLIVVDKLLTGFDVPCATYLYIDQDMRDHKLFQAICRVNRLGVDLKDENGNKIFTHKEYGIIVDFKHLFDNIETAVTRFNDDSGKNSLDGFDPEDIEDLMREFVLKNKIRLIAAEKAYKALMTNLETKGLTDAKKIAEYYKPESMKEERTQLYQITANLVVAYSDLADYMGEAEFTSEQADEYEDMAREASHINLRVKQVSGDDFDPRCKDSEMRSLLDQYLRANNSKTIVPATADFSFLDLLDMDETEAADKAAEEAGSEESAAEIIEGKARATINDFKEKDLELYLAFSKRLQDLLDRLKQETATFKQQAIELIKLIKATKNRGSNYPDGIKSDRAKALWNNRSKWTNSDEDFYIVGQIEQIEYLVENKAGMDWKDPSSVDAYMFKQDLQSQFEELSEEQIMEIYILLGAN